MDFIRRRKFCLAAVCLIEAAAGFIYAWSVFGAELSKNHGWNSTQTTYVFTVATISTMLTSMFLVKRIRKWLPLRKVIWISMVLMAIGFIPLGFFINNVFMFYLFYAVIGGIGNALVYPVLIGYSQELYPDRAGMASGVAVGGFGMGAIIWAPLAALLIQKVGIETTFIVMGIAFSIIFFIFSFFLVEPTAEFKSEMYQTAVTNKKTFKSYSEKNIKQILKSKEFYPMYLTLSLGIACGMMIVTKISGIMQTDFQFTPATASLVVSMVALFNTLGRFGIAWISDRIGRFQAVMLVQATFTVTLIIMGISSNVIVFLALLVLVSLSYGGVSSIVAPATGYVFGQKNIVGNYSFMFSVFALGSIIGPSLYSILPNTSLVFITAGAIAFVGFLNAFYLARKVRVQ